MRNLIKSFGYVKKQHINWLPVFHWLFPCMDSIQQLWFTTPTRTETMLNVWDQAISGQVALIQVPTNYSFYDLGHHGCQWNGGIVLRIWFISRFIYWSNVCTFPHCGYTPDEEIIEIVWSVMVLSQMLLPWEILLECCLDHRTYWHLSVCMVNMNK